MKIILNLLKLILPLKLTMLVYK